MIEIVQNLFSMVAEFINWFFTLEIDFYQNQKISIGELVVLFVFLMVGIYIVLEAIGILKKGDDK